MKKWQYDEKKMHNSALTQDLRAVSEGLGLTIEIPSDSSGDEELISFETVESGRRLSTIFEEDGSGAASAASAPVPLVFSEYNNNINSLEDDLSDSPRNNGKPKSPRLFG